MMHQVEGPYKIFKGKEGLQMKVLSIILVVILLVALAVPVFADKDGVPNDNAGWGQMHKEVAATASVSAAIHYQQGVAEAAGTNLGQLFKDALKPLY
jgi:hypothetical protein